MSEVDPAPAPFSSWFGPIPAWRFAIFAVVGTAAHLALPHVLEEAEIRPLLLVGVLAGGTALGVPMGRHDARRSLRPRRPHRAGLPGAGTILVGLTGTALVLAQTLSDAVAVHLPLVLAAIGAAGAGGAWTRDRSIRRISRTCGRSRP